MAVIIRGKRPESCDKCWNRPSCEVYFRQVDRLSQSDNAQVFDIFGEMRLKECPILGELPDHYGRLIDADALIGSAYEIQRQTHVSFPEALAQVFMDAPTVLEASDGTCN